MLGAADALRFDFELAPEAAPARFAQAVEEQIEASNAEQLRVVHSLTPLQSAVLRVMARQGARYAPFEAETLAALQEKALVWRAARGVYALEDAALGELLAQEGMLLTPNNAGNPTP